jgi:hypothetical protein
MEFCLFVDETVIHFSTQQIFTLQKKILDEERKPEVQNIRPTV